MSAAKSRDAFSDLLDVLRQASERCVGAEWGVTDPDDVGDGLRNLTHILQSALLRTRSSIPIDRCSCASSRPLAASRVTIPTRSISRPRSADRASTSSRAIWPARSTRRSRWKRARATASTRWVPQGCCATTTSIPTPPVTTRSASAAPPPSATGWRFRPKADASPRATIRMADVRVGFANTAHPAVDRGDGACGAAWLMGRRERRSRHRTRHQSRAGQDDRRAPTGHQRTGAVRLGDAQPVPPAGCAGQHGLRLFDAAYSMAPYRIGPDEALIITGRWPTCRFANVCLWTRFRKCTTTSTVK